MKIKHLMFGSVLIIFSVIFDQFTKLLALANLKSGSITVIENFFRLKLYYNDGAAWSSFEGQFGFLMFMTVISLVAFLFFFKSVDFQKKIIYSIGISLMIGGLFGNLIDRVFMDGNVVVDFLSFQFGSYSFPIFNIADVCLVVGVALFIIDILFFESKRKAKENEQLQD